MWIRREVFNKMVKNAEDLKTKVYNLKNDLQDAEREKGMKQDYLRLLKDRNEEIQKLKEHLKAKEEMFIGRTVKKLLNEIGKPTVVHNHHSPRFPIASRGGLLGGGL